MDVCFSHATALLCYRSDLFEARYGVRGAEMRSGAREAGMRCNADDAHGADGRGLRCDAPGAGARSGVRRPGARYGARGAGSALPLPAGDIGRARRSSALPRRVPAKSEALGCLSAEVELALSPLHLLVPSAADRCRACGVVSHVCPRSLPAGSFIHPRKGLYVSSPELCFVQMATMLPFADLVRLGFELCGTYSYRADSTVRYGLRPLTDVPRLARYVDAAAGMDGSVAAKRAVGYLVQGSASPMETSLVLLLCLPVRLGGYGLPFPLMNHRVELGNAGKAGADVRGGLRRSYRLCDLYWPCANVATEYDSDEFHAGALRMARDASRRIELASLGIQVVTITRRQVMDYRETEKAALLLAKLLGRRIRPGKCDWTGKRFGLRRSLLRQAAVGFDGASVQSQVPGDEQRL